MKSVTPYLVQKLTIRPAEHPTLSEASLGYPQLPGAPGSAFETAHSEIHVRGCNETNIGKLNLKQLNNMTHDEQNH